VIYYPAHRSIEALGPAWLESWRTVPSLTHGANLYAEAVESAPDGARFVELGVYGGAGLLLLDALAKASGKRLELFGVDLWLDWPTPIPVTRNDVETTLARWRCDAELVYADTAKAAEQFADRSCWFVYVDGDHKFESVLADCRAWAPKVADGGWIAGDDWDVGEVKQAVVTAFGDACIVTPGDAVTRVWRADPRSLLP